MIVGCHWAPDMSLNAVRIYVRQSRPGYGTNRPEHVAELWRWSEPPTDGVEEVREGLGDAVRIGLDDHADPSEGRLLLFVVSDLRQRLTPILNEDGQIWRDLIRTDETQSTDGHSRVLVERSKGLGMEQDRDELAEQWLDVRLDLRARLERNLASCPSCVVAD